MCVEPPWERIEPFKGWTGATSRPQANGLLCRGKLWLEERTPEQLKGEGGKVDILDAIILIHNSRPGPVCRREQGFLSGKGLTEEE